MNEEERSLFNESETNFSLPHIHAALSFSATLCLAGYNLIYNWLFSVPSHLLKSPCFVIDVSNLTWEL